MTCEICKARPATMRVTKNKEPLVTGLDSRTGLVQAVRVACDECAKGWAANAKQPLG
ncbi:MAG TPA: hypothetical protein VM736_14770 [Gemmatimonadales bacterium]|nr:hypothetical protein [Gemmatimonadales bacterium]